MTENDMLDCLRKMYCQQRIDEYTASIQNLSNQSDVEALAVAIADCTPEQVARWFCEVLNAQTAYFDIDERVWLTNEENDWRAEDGA